LVTNALSRKEHVHSVVVA
jgi:hypothetical protein